MPRANLKLGTRTSCYYCSPCSYSLFEILRTSQGFSRTRLFNKHLWKQLLRNSRSCRRTREGTKRNRHGACFVELAVCSGDCAPVSAPCQAPRSAWGRGCGRETGPSEEVLMLSAEKHVGDGHPHRSARETRGAGARGGWPRLLRVRTGTSREAEEGAVSPQEENSVFHLLPPGKRPW